MQSASSRIWTRVAVSISYDDNHYTRGMIGYHAKIKEPIIYPYFAVEKLYSCIFSKYITADQTLA